jgi:MFS family permease
MVRRGRRAGLALGYLLGVTGALVAVAAMALHSLPVLLAGTTLIGFGSSSNQLSRYAAADMFPVARRGSAIATVVWGATIGAVIGPNLIAAAGDFADSQGLPVVAGAYLIPAVFVGLAAALCFAFLRPDPYALAAESPEEAAREGPDAVAVPVRDLLARPIVLAALVVLVVGQMSMTIVMTMTPLHITEHGGGLAAVGFVLSAHAFGMYALAPVSGRLTDHFGSQRVILAGLTTLAAAGLLAGAAPPDGGPVLLAALFLLGFGWNLGFVAGSTLLASGLAIAERTRLQGVTDTIIWTSAAFAAMASGVIVALVSYTGLGILPALLVMTPAWLMVRRRRAISAAGPLEVRTSARPS